MKHQKDILDTLKKFELTSDFEKKQAIFEQLDLAIKTVFKKEEVKYRACGFPDTELHTRQHDECVRTLASFYHYYFATKKRRTQKAVNEIVEFVPLWIEDHQQFDDFGDSFRRVWEFANGL